MYQLEIKERAVEMMQESYAWYEQAQQGLGAQFLESLDEAYDKIAAHPEYFSLIEKQYRQIKLSIFPYVIVYEIMEDKVVVFALFHTSRNPELKISDKE